MSGIYIPDMEMPKACFKGVFDHCPFYADCKALRRFCDIHGNTEIIYTIYTSRLEDCTLKEVPTHGDLVDRQKLIKELSKAWDVDDDQDFANKSVWRIVEKEAPTIIEASTDDTEERE